MKKIYNGGFHKTLLTTCTGLFMLFTAFGQSDSKIRVNGFGDMTYGYTSGNYANPTARANFEANGESTYPFNVNTGGFGIVGTDFVVTSDISDNLIFQTELNLQVERGEQSDIEMDVERAYLDYKISDVVGFQTGLFFTPIGFSNRNLYARAWLMNSSQIREIVEESTGLVPTHSIGMNFYGKAFLGDHALSYIVSAGNGRGADPVTVFYNRNTSDPMYTGLLEWIIPAGDDFRIGISGFYSGNFKTPLIDSIGQTVDMATAQQLTLTESGINPYIYYKGKVFNLLAEMHQATISEVSNHLTANKNTELTAMSVELGINLTFKDKRLIPYVRYDQLNIDNNSPYYGIRVDGDMASRIYVPGYDAAMIGFAYDLSTFNRIKFEFIRHMDGPRKENGFVIQTAFGF